MTLVLIGPFMLFVLFVAPLWLVLHYRSKRKFDNVLNEDDLILLDELSRKAGRLKQRITTLESILDVEAPHWRQRHE